MFGNSDIAFLNELSDAEIIGIFEGVPNFTIEKSALTAGISAVDLLATHTAVFPSKGEAKKMIQGGGVAINKAKIGAAEDVYNIDTLINEKFIIVQKGKRNYFLIIAE